MAREGDDRRNFKRVNAPVLCRSARFTLRAPPVDIGLGGLRVYSDESFKIGERLEIELLLPEGETLICLTKVAWINELTAPGVAKFDIGLQFLEVPPEVRERLATVLNKR